MACQILEYGSSYIQGVPKDSRFAVYLSRFRAHYVHLFTVAFIRGVITWLCRIFGRDITACFSLQGSIILSVAQS